MIGYLDPTFWVKFYFYETSFVLLLILFIISYIQGCNKNRLVAKRYFITLHPIIKEYFKNVGKYSAGEFQLYDEDRTHIFKMYASGHDTMVFCLITIYLKVRENMFNYYIYDFIFPTRERIVFEIGVRTKNKALVCFGIMKEKQIKKVKSEGYADLKNICEKYEVNLLDKQLIVVTEFPEIAEQIMTPQVTQLINECSRYIHIIYISDVDKDPAAKVSIRIMSNLLTHTNINVKDYENLMRLIQQLSEKVSLLKLSQNKMTKSIIQRKKYKSKLRVTED